MLHKQTVAEWGESWRGGVAASFAQPTALLLGESNTVGVSQARQKRTGGALSLLSQLWR